MGAKTITNKGDQRVLNLTVSQRVNLFMLVGASSGAAPTTQDLRLNMRILDVLELNEEEQERCGYERTEKDNGDFSIDFDKGRDFTAALKFSPELWARLKQVMNSVAPRLNAFMMRQWANDVLEQLGI